MQIGDFVRQSLTYATDLRGGLKAAVAEFHVLRESAGEFRAVGDADQKDVLLAAQFQ